MRPYSGSAPILGFLTSAWNRAELLHQLEGVHDDPALREIAAPDHVDHDLPHLHPLPSRCGPQEGTAMGARPSEAAHDLVPLRDLLVQRPMNVGEGVQE